MFVKSKTNGCKYWVSDKRKVLMDGMAWETLFGPNLHQTAFPSASSQLYNNPYGPSKFLRTRYTILVKCSERSMVLLV